ncbi:MAG TPA: CHASE3 domain-containing protein [Verrucomicrobiae bacterium]|nr:CHASE3 domain-containing protein [Verrucomicrobiae bacterium]
MIPTQKTKRALFWLGLSLPMVALIAMTWLVHKSGGEFNNSFNWVLRNYKVLDMFEQTQAHIVDAESNQRGYLLTGREEYVEPYRAAMTAVDDDLAQLKRFTVNDPAQQANLAALELLVTNELVFDPATAFSSGQFSTNESVVALTARGKAKIDSMRRVLFTAREEQEQALSKHQQAAETDVVSTQVMSLVLIVGVAVALVFVVVILLRLEKLQQFVTVCAWTGQVRYQGQWLRLDEFLKHQFGISVSHSLSKEAADKMMREIEELNRPGARPDGSASSPRPPA